MAEVILHDHWKIATRCGQDADCNPSTVGGILGAVLGYNKIPAYWKMGLKEAEGIDFKYTTMSLNAVYEIGFRQAIQNIEMHGGQLMGDSVHILLQSPAVVKWEKSFEGHFPVKKMPVEWSASKNEVEFDFEGIGFVLKGDASPWGNASDYIFNTELYLDGKLIESPKLPVSYTTRRYELCWKYQLPKGKHHVRFRIVNASADHPINLGEAIIYSDHLINGPEANNQKSK